MQDSANNHNSGAEKDHFSSTQKITNEDGNNCSNEAADVVARYGDALNGCNVGVSSIIDGVDLWKLTDPASKGQKPAHHTLVITKETICLSVQVLKSSN